ncbi:Zinc finger protein [Plakobranchus ocellatus]|uniref:Zinc finger protein n=1 Tax=Plakobranchus ocellatus TaxID=259542 RepID=A0AAV4BEP0_9GAST|nr:Zinc finger protein [Plakobranchus ocellatus]
MSSSRGTTLVMRHRRMRVVVDVNDEDSSCNYCSCEALPKLCGWGSRIRKGNSPYATPAVMVKKQDRSNRICIDYRCLNKLTVFDPHPMIPPADVLQGIKNDRYFSKKGLGKGYGQIPVRQENIVMTAFMTMARHYKFLRMPFGMLNSRARLARAMKMLVRGMTTWWTM